MDQPENTLPDPPDYDQEIAEIAAKLRTRTDMKLAAQDLLMEGLAKVLGYWTESDQMTAQALDKLGGNARRDFEKIMRREAMRVAKMFGWDRLPHA